MFFDENIVPERGPVGRVHALTALIQGYLTEPLPIAKLTKLAGMSIRTFAQVCGREWRSKVCAMLPARERGPSRR
jgi:transcriptional regulator GlxA family with amidase domain